MNRRLVIGDIHGCIKTLVYILSKVIKFNANDSIYFLGDYIDRGTDSKAVLDFLINLQSSDSNATFLRGNHEDMALNSYKSESDFGLWMMNGGEQTLRSFGVKNILDLPEKYSAFLHSTHFYMQLDDFILVHAGLDFETENPFNNYYDMLWTRSQKVDLSKTGGRRVIVGHTPVSLEHVTESLSSNLIMLDGGCVYKNIPHLGNLCALELNTMKLYSASNIE
jgi:serine/threonine protein phosphatase 1